MLCNGKRGRIMGMLLVATLILWCPDRWTRLARALKRAARWSRDRALFRRQATRVLFMFTTPGSGLQRGSKGVLSSCSCSAATTIPLSSLCNLLRLWSRSL